MKFVLASVFASVAGAGWFVWPCADGAACCSTQTAAPETESCAIECVTEEGETLRCEVRCEPTAEAETVAQPEAECRDEPCVVECETESGEILTCEVSCEPLAAGPAAAPTAAADACVIECVDESGERFRCQIQSCTPVAAEVASASCESEAGCADEGAQSAGCEGEQACAPAEAEPVAEVDSGC